MNSKAEKLWRVNVISFIILMLLVVTGMANWLVFPGGSHGAGSSIRGFLCAVHRWSAVGFILMIGVHLFFHLDYINKSLEKYGLLRKR
ncbi:MAG: hypothetical protein ACOZF0_11830 [Thermodesulfobacteriota bacterium]